MKRLKTILHYHSKHFKYIAIITIIYSLININFFPYQSKYSKEETKFEGTITKLKIKENKLTIYIKGKENIIINYYQEDFLILHKNLNIGDTIYIKGTLSTPKANTIPNNFNYKKYLYNNKIYYLVNAQKITKIKNNVSIINHIKNKLNNYIDSNIKKSSPYIKTFILGQKDFLEEEVLSSYQNNGLTHLLSISGLHLSLLIGTIFLILKKLTHRIVTSYIICIVMALIYMLFLNFTPSILRSGIMYILLSINKIYNLKIKTIDLMYLNLIIILVINPFYLVNLGFQLSYLVSYFLILTSYKIKNIHNYFLKLLITSIISTLASFPILIYNFYEINIISIIINFIFIPIISYIVLPLSFICLIVPHLDIILATITTFLEKISLIFSTITITKIIFPKPSYLLIIIYYIILLLSIKNKKFIFIIPIIIFYSQIKIYLDNNFYITFLDVAQGDSAFIRYPHNKLNILIDTGGNYRYETAKSIITYLKSINVKKLDYLILTHGDFDHMGEAIKLVENFKVENVIFNCGEFNELEQDLIKVLDEKKIPYYSCIKELNIDNNKLYFLNKVDYGNENDNSSVIYTKLNNHKFLFMGDTGAEVEKDIIEKYNLKDIDVLKVGHHGSGTSSSEEFINNIVPKYSIISVGKNNKYGHPNKEVLNRLENTKIYRTDKQGSIMFKIKNDKLKIETCVP